MYMPEALKGLVAVIEFGEEKYTPAFEKGWMGYTMEDTMDSLLRHTQDYINGEQLDQESGLPHIWHMLFNAAVLCELNPRTLIPSEDLPDAIGREGCRIG
jgi:hypothetical protein